MDAQSLSKGIQMRQEEYRVGQHISNEWRLANEQKALAKEKNLFEITIRKINLYKDFINNLCGSFNFRKYMY